MSVNTKMTAIADKIRGLLGLTGTMGLDAMATHLGTEQANITAALAALSGKGVTVPSGANSDDLAELIAGIEAGGGSGGGKIATGTFTPAQNTALKGWSFAHNLGEMPQMFVVYNDTFIISGGAGVGCVLIAPSTMTEGYWTEHIFGSKSTYGEWTGSLGMLGTQAAFFSESTATLNYSGSEKFASGVTYKWYAIGG